MPKGKPQPPTSGRSVPTSVRLGAETRALWAELAGWLELSQAGALAVAIRELHDREKARRNRRGETNVTVVMHDAPAREAERRAKREKRK